MRLKNKILLSAGLLGITSPVIAETSYQCLSCPAGTYSSAGATSCTSCLTTGVEACNSITGKATSCKAGYGYSNGSCSICAAGKYSAGGTAGCSTCPAGTYSAAGASGCTSCLTGKYSAAGASSCTACTNSKPSSASYTSNATSNSCSWSCNSGYTKVGNYCCSGSVNIYSGNFYRGNGSFTNLYTSLHCGNQISLDSNCDGTAYSLTKSSSTSTGGCANNALNGFFYNCTGTLQTTPCY